MPNERFLELGVLAVFNALESGTIGLNVQLSDIESDQGLAANTIPRPVDIIDCFLPNSTFHPLVMVYDTDSEVDHRTAQQRNSEMNVNGEIAIQFVTDVKVSTGARHLRRYVTAIRQVVDAWNASPAAQSPGSSQGVIGITINSPIRSGITPPFGVDDNLNVRRVAIIPFKVKVKG